MTFHSAHLSHPGLLERLRPLFLALLLPALLGACSSQPRRGESGSTWIPSPNFDERRPNLVIIHHTTNDTVDRALQTLTSPEKKVSAHYLIGRDGTVFQLVDERDRAWHGGLSYWGGQTDINSASIGIELDNNGREPFAEPQIQSLLALLADLKARYGIPTANFIGHADVAPTRKNDPSPLFPWQRLAEQGFGLWCRPPYPPAPESFDILMGLMALGYSVTDPASALKAFQIHFVREEGDTAKPESVRIAALVNCLVRRKAAE